MNDKEAEQVDLVAGLVKDFLSTGSKRGQVLLNQIFLNGSVSTETLEELGYKDPASAARDVRDAGIPLLATPIKRSSGSRGVEYSLGASSDIRDGRFNGRSVIPKALRAKVLAHYGDIDWITGVQMPQTSLQMDHRIPFRVAGDANAANWTVEDFMPLDGSSQRSKSWACEGCDNFTLLNPQTCRACYWAYPEAYTHIAMKPLRRTEIVWEGMDVDVHDSIAELAQAEGISIRELLLRLSRITVLNA